MVSSHVTFITTRQAADMLHVSMATLKKFIYQGRLRTLKTPGGHHRILRSDLFEMSGPGQSSGSTPAMPEAVLRIIRGLNNSLERRRASGKGHAQRVADLSVLIAKKSGLTPAQEKRVYHAALLHDIGMLSIAKDIINNAGKLSPEEFNIIKLHPARGQEIVEDLDGLHDVAPIIRQHHERYDGKGYPDGLQGKNIALEARIICVAEAFDSMIAQNSYKKLLSREEACREIDKNSGKQFDPALSAVCLESIRRNTVLARYSRERS